MFWQFFILAGLGTVDAEADLVAWWKMDEGSGAIAAARRLKVESGMLTPKVLEITPPISYSTAE